MRKLLALVALCLAAAAASAQTRVPISMLDPAVAPKTYVDAAIATEVTNRNAAITAAVSGATPASTVKAADRQVFTANGTWTKPTGFGAKAMVFVELWGGGGAGGGGLYGAGGGGGGAYVSGWFPLSALAATEAVVVGAGGTRVASDVQPTAGGNSSFHGLTAYGGAGGGGTAAGTAVLGQGGGGGGTLGPGQTNGFGGAPIMYDGSGTGVQATSSDSGGGAGPAAAGPGGSSVRGGGGGASSAQNLAAAYKGGDSIYGGGGGGSRISSANGAGGTSVFGGAGGAGSTGTATAGTAPGGGGGAGANNSGGLGARGEVRITVFDGV